MLRPELLVSYQSPTEEKLSNGHTNGLQTPYYIDPLGGWASPLEVPRAFLGVCVYFLT
jgi:hypothetical protein